MPFWKRGNIPYRDAGSAAKTRRIKNIMSEHEDMLLWWTITLIEVLDGLTMASVQMEIVGEGEKSVGVLEKDMRNMMSGYPPEQKQLLARQFALLSGLALRVEPPS